MLSYNNFSSLPKPVLFIIFSYIPFRFYEGLFIYFPKLRKFTAPYLKLHYISKRLYWKADPEFFGVDDAAALMLDPRTKVQTLLLLIMSSYGEYNLAKRVYKKLESKNETEFYVRVTVAPIYDNCLKFVKSYKSMYTCGISFVHEQFECIKYMLQEILFRDQVYDIVIDKCTNIKVSTEQIEFIKEYIKIYYNHSIKLLLAEKFEVLEALKIPNRYFNENTIKAYHHKFSEKSLLWMSMLSDRVVKDMMVVGSRKADHAMFKIALNAGADASHNKWLPLRWAARRGDVEMIEFIVKKYKISQMPEIYEHSLRWAIKDHNLEACKCIKKHMPAQEYLNVIKYSVQSYKNLLKSGRKYLKKDKQYNFALWISGEILEKN